MTAEGIRLTPNPFACLDAERVMEEDRGPDTPTYLDGPARKRLAEVSFRQLEEFFKLVPLPRVVICASRHSPIVDLSPLDMPVATRAENDGLVEKLAADAIVGYQRLAQRYVASAQDPETLSSEEASIWIQTGLALTPFAFADTRYSVDWAIAWAMIGEWTNHQLFPPPKSGEWPRFAHVNGLEEGFRYRQPSLVTWARACFEQGALPSLAVLPGEVEVRSMVGDKMFQATHIVDGYQRPCVLHGYGGAKSSMPTSLPELATKGWTVIAAALLGTNGKPP